MTGALGDDSLAVPLRKAIKDNGEVFWRIRSAEDIPTSVGDVLVEIIVLEDHLLFDPGASHDFQPVEFETLDSLDGGGHRDTLSKLDLLSSQMELRKEKVVQVLRPASENE